MTLTCAANTTQAAVVGGVGTAAGRLQPPARPGDHLGQRPERAAHRQRRRGDRSTRRRRPSSITDGATVADASTSRCPRTARDRLTRQSSRRTGIFRDARFVFAPPPMNAPLPQVPRPVVTGASGFVGARAGGAPGRAGHPVAAPRATGGKPLEALDLRGRDRDPPGRARPRPARAATRDFERDNVEKTSVLAHAAAAAGAARFVFASTVKVFGEESGAAAVHASSDEPRPRGCLRAVQVAGRGGARPGRRRAPGCPWWCCAFPSPTGPGVGGNFRALARLADSGWWLPFGAHRQSPQPRPRRRPRATRSSWRRTHEGAPGRDLHRRAPRAGVHRAPGRGDARRARPTAPALRRCPPALLEAARRDRRARRAGSAASRARSRSTPRPVTRATGWQARVEARGGASPRPLPRRRA